ncbi:MAG: helix-turn-helix domain-containing protein [Myxococcales bacterium]
MAPRSYSSAIRDAQVEQTRALLLETARTMLAEGGIDALTLPRLAQVAGVSVPTVYRHFPSLDDLFRAFLEWLRPRLGLTEERLMSVTPEQLPAVPGENFPRYEAESGVLRPLMESREFNRVRVASMRDRARKAAARLKAESDGWSDAEREARAGAIWVLQSPHVWRWMRDTWGLDNEEAAEAASWAMATLRDALRRGKPENTKAKSKGKIRTAPQANTGRANGKAKKRA